MRAARITKDLLAADTHLAGVPVLTQQPSSTPVPSVVVTTVSGYASDERTGVVVTIAVDTYAASPAEAEDLGWTVRTALAAAAARHAIRAVRTLSVPTQVPLEGQPADLARCTATYTLSLPIT